MELSRAGQSIWLDNISRAHIMGGTLRSLIEQGLTGLTSNPTIFDKAISSTDDYDNIIEERVSAGCNVFEIYDDLTVRDVRDAADLFRPVYDATKKRDGYVSLEVNPKLAWQYEETIHECRRLLKKVGRPNVMFKIPATKAGIAAVEDLIADGININVTLIFSLAQYRASALAYMRGVKRYLDHHDNAENIASVASVFVSRLDTAVDGLLEGRAADDPEDGQKYNRLMGKAAVANVQIIYAAYKEICSGPEFTALAEKGARPQRALWASTSTKNKAYQDIKYVAELIGRDTVNTVPDNTLKAFLDRAVSIRKIYVMTCWKKGFRRSLPHLIHCFPRSRKNPAAYAPDPEKRDEKRPGTEEDDMTVSITFCGGAQTVTGSLHLISTPASNVILDCGLFHGPRDEYYSVNSYFPFDPQHLDACVISHAHIDHCGNLPTLIKQGFRSSIYCTPTTRDLCRYMLPDSGFIQEEDIKYVNKINKKRGLPGRQPLYTKNEAEKSLRYFRTLDCHKALSIAKDVDVTFYEAGHILGSAIPVVTVKTPRNPIRIAYAVDLGRTNMPLLKNPEIPHAIDYLVIESTYGGRRHIDMKTAEVLLAEAINRTVKRGGKIIIPSFALERTQFIVFFISELMKKNKIKKIPIYVDGPLAVNLTKVFRNNWQYFDEITQMAFLSKEDPLGYDNITYITNVNRSKKLNTVTKPCIIISASGMCENGRILHHLRNNIENPKNTILVIGYMARDTLGRRIVEKQQPVRIFGRLCDMRAEVVVINSFSSHADEAGLIQYALDCSEKLKQVFIVHGEMEQSEALRKNLRRHLKIKPVIPKKGETIYLRS